MKNAVEMVNLNVTKIAHSVIEQEIKGLESLKNTFCDKFNDLIDLLIGIKGRVIVSGMGKSGHVARKIASTLASTGTPSMYLHPSEASHGDLGNITEDDVVILLSNSGESAELVDIIDYCKRFDISLVSITRNIDSSLSQNSNIAIVLPNIPEASQVSAPTTSTTMMIAYGDAIAVVLHELRGFGKSEFRVYHPGGKIGSVLLKVADLMHVDAAMPVVRSTASLKDGILEMSNKRLGCVGVVDEQGEFLGIFTDGDLRRHIDSNFSDTKICDVMTIKPITFQKQQFASEALAIMNKKLITVGFVLDGDKPIGVLHMHDILKAKVA
jgi:arabinose-5-phosphate isomerase